MIQVNPMWHKNDSWAIGAIVKIGFLKCEVLKAIPTPKDCAPDQYLVRLVNNHVHPRYYLFTPHKGLAGVAEGYAEDVMHGVATV